MAERCVLQVALRPAPLCASRAALLQDSSQAGLRVVALQALQALLGRGTRLPRHGTGVRSWLGEAYLTGFQVDRRGLLSVGQMRGQREGGKLYGAFLELR